MNETIGEASPQQDKTDRTRLTLVKTNATTPSSTDAPRPHPRPSTPSPDPRAQTRSHPQLPSANDTWRIRLTAKEFDYLLGCGYFNDEHVRALRRRELCLGGRVVLPVNTASAAAFREAFTGRLTRLGTDQDFEPPWEASLLMDLRRRFEVPVD